MRNKRIELSFKPSTFGTSIETAPPKSVTSFPPSVTLKLKKYILLYFGNLLIAFAQASLSVSVLPVSFTRLTLSLAFSEINFEVE